MTAHSAANEACLRHMKRAFGAVKCALCACEIFCRFAAKYL